jgi:oxaloacetate decarboxylase gamma subunit
VSSELLQQGVQLMLAGMGVVFSLLGLLVLALKVMSRVAGMLEPPQPVAQTSGSGTNHNADDPELIAAVTAAIRANREEAQN